MIVRFVQEFPGQESQTVELPPHMIDNIAKSGELPPFYEAYLAITDALSRKCSDDEVTKSAKLVALLGGNR